MSSQLGHRLELAVEDFKPLRLHVAERLVGEHHLLGASIQDREYIVALSEEGGDEVRDDGPVEGALDLGQAPVEDSAEAARRFLRDVGDDARRRGRGERRRPQVQDVKAANPDKFCSAFGLGPGSKTLPDCAGPAGGGNGTDAATGRPFSARVAVGVVAVAAAVV